jgi:ribose 5-phosphate isomerase A
VRDLTAQDRAKRHVGIAALERYVRPGMRLGLGSGTTSHWFVRALGQAVSDGLSVNGVPTSISTQELAVSLGIPLLGFGEFDRLDLVVDGPDEVDANGYMIKGGGACLLWERIVADTADHYVCVADTSKLVDRLGRFPLPIEVVQHGWEATTRSIRELLALHGYADVRLVRRAVDGEPVVTDSGNYLVDAHLEALTDPLALDRELNWIPGVVENGLFTGIADEVIFSDPDGNVTVMPTSSAPAARPTTTPRGRRLLSADTSPRAHDTP